MAKENRNSGCETRYDQQAVLEEVNRKRSTTGQFQSFICPVCDKPRGKGRNHDKCSKILQKERC